MAETKFKKVDFEDLSVSTKSVIEANAASQGVTPEQYYESRGGVNRAGYFGDAYQAAEQGGRPYLSDEQYFAALEGLTGVARGQAINLATAKNQYDIFISQGLSSADASARSGYDPATNSLVSVSSSSGDTGGTGFRGSGSTTNLAAQQAAAATAAAERANRQSAYDLLFQQFDAYGLGALVSPLKGLIESGISPSEFTIKLRETDAYKKRFAANQARINKGLRALSEAEYIGLEDQYQDVMRRYGLPQEYYARGDMGRQEGFEKFIGGDVSPVELEDRVQTAQRRVLNAAPQVKAALTQFYGAEIGNGDILAYVLDPDKAIENIKRKVTAAEIGGGAMRAGLGLARARAEELGQYGVTGEQAVTGFGTIASGLERGRQLSQIYNQPDYTQAVAEAEVFALPDAEKARRQRRKLGQLETAEFGGTSGITGGALGRERAGQY